MGNHQFIRVYNSTNDYLKLEIVSPGYRMERHVFEIPPRKNISQNIKKGDVIFDLYVMYSSGIFFFI